LFRAVYRFLEVKVLLNMTYSEDHRVRTLFEFDQHALTPSSKEQSILFCANKYDVSRSAVYSYVRERSDSGQIGPLRQRDGRLN
jgi:hypothetical protein